MAANDVIEHESATLEEIDEPPMYKVFMHNDETTTMDFVEDILQRIFNKSAEEARDIMLHVHHNGIGLCGIYTREIAEAKVNLVTSEARRASFPLKCTMEKE